MLQEITLKLKPEQIDLVLLSLSEYNAKWSVIDPVIKDIRAQAIAQIKEDEKNNTVWEPDVQEKKDNVVKKVASKKK